jgi:membrane carboxypeptidase/penicillin-binding protein PbpC
MVDGYGPKSRGLELAARGEALRWYVDGAPIAEANGQVVWRPGFPGFYRITAIDAHGRQTTARVRIR